MSSRIFLRANFEESEQVESDPREDVEYARSSNPQTIQELPVWLVNKLSPECFVIVLEIVVVNGIRSAAEDPVATAEVNRIEESCRNTKSLSIFLFKLELRLFHASTSLDIAELEGAKKYMQATPQKAF